MSGDAPPAADPGATHKPAHWETVYEDWLNMWHELATPKPPTRSDAARRRERVLQRLHKLRDARLATRERMDTLAFFTQALAGPVVGAARVGLTTKELQVVAPIIHTQHLLVYINDVYGSLVRGKPDAYIHDMFFRRIRTHSPVCLLNVLGFVGKELYKDLHWPFATLAAAYDAAAQTPATSTGTSGASAPAADRGVEESKGDAADALHAHKSDDRTTALRRGVHTLVRAYIVGVITQLLSHTCTGCDAADMPATISNEVLFTSQVAGDKERSDGSMNKLLTLLGSLASL